MLGLNVLARTFASICILSAAIGLCGCDCGSARLTPPETDPGGTHTCGFVSPSGDVKVGHDGSITTLEVPGVFLGASQESFEVVNSAGAVVASGTVPSSSSTTSTGSLTVQFGTNLTPPGDYRVRIKNATPGSVCNGTTLGTSAPVTL